MDWDKFIRLSGHTQSYMIAVYEAHTQIEAVLSDAATKKGQ